jgi:hypothetical protein
VPGQTPAGEYVLGVLLKRELPQSCLAEHAFVPMPTGSSIPATKHWGDPMNTSVKWESDFVPFKLATDVVLNGTAHAPMGTADDGATSRRFRWASTARASEVVGDRLAFYQEGATPVFSEPARSPRWSSATSARTAGWTSTPTPKSRASTLETISVEALP